MIGVLISLAVTVLVVWILLKKMKAQFVLFFGGLVLLVSALAMDALGLLPNGAQILPKGVSSTGFVGFDLFKCITSLMSSRVAGIGLLIMAASGYSTYMAKIGASALMADYISRPLRVFKSPYLVLALSYVVGAVADLFIPSASGLSMLLMVTMYPVLVRLGVSRLSAAALIITVSCLDMGPTSGAANYAAQVAGMDTMTYFIEYQLPVGIVTTIAVAVLHYFSQKYFDAKDGEKANEIDETVAKQNDLDSYNGMLGFLDECVALFLDENSVNVTEHVKCPDFDETSVSLGKDVTNVGGPDGWQAWGGRWTQRDITAPFTSIWMKREIDGKYILEQGGLYQVMENMPAGQYMFSLKVRAAKYKNKNNDIDYDCAIDQYLDGIGMQPEVHHG